MNLAFLSPPLRLLALALGTALAAAAPAQAQELAWSGFGTLGATASNRDFTYQRYIDHHPSLERDTLFGVQADLRMSPQWSATVQLKLAPSLKADSRWDVTPTWAFVAWRPADDWLLRAGRVRAPLYLYSESMDVGQTHDMARLPTELYSVAPTTDVDGAYLTRTWALGAHGERELSADLYTGSANTTARFWSRDGVPPQIQPGMVPKDINVQLQGLALTLRQTDLVLRTSLHRARTRTLDGHPLPVVFPKVDIGPGLSYYQIDNGMPGPGVPTVPFIRNTIFSLGAELGLGQGWRVAGEYVRNRQHDTEVGSDTTGSYLALFHQIGAVTPYVSVARLSSRPLAQDWYNRLTSNPLPDFIPGAAQLNGAQRLAAESIWLADQRSLAIGAAWALSPGVKLKGEWMRSHIGQVSRLVDTPPGRPTVSNTSIDVLSLNLNFAF